MTARNFARIPQTAKSFTSNFTNGRSGVHARERVALESNSKGSYALGKKFL